MAGAQAASPPPPVACPLGDVGSAGWAGWATEAVGLVGVEWLLAGTTLLGLLGRGPLACWLLAGRLSETGVPGSSWSSASVCMACLLEAGAAVGELALPRRDDLSPALAAEALPALGGWPALLACGSVRGTCHGHAVGGEG